MDEYEDADGIIVGIMESTNGRECMIYNCCGISLAVNDVVKFKQQKWVS